MEELELSDSEIQKIDEQNDRPDDDDYSEDDTPKKRVKVEEEVEEHDEPEEPEGGNDEAADSSSELENGNVSESSEDIQPVKRGRGRPPGSKNKVTLAKEMQDKQRIRRRLLAEAGLEEDGDIDDEEVNREYQKEQQKQRKRPGRKPGFKLKKKIYSPFPKPLDEDGNEISLNETEDEYKIAADEKGETKIDADGNLLDGRDFRVRTFTVLNRGNKLYMLSTEPARCLGYRDAYYLFLKHNNLFKFVLSMDEKQDLVDRKIIPNSYKSRTIGLVTAKSVFKEFGARIVIGGKKITDDYLEEVARAAGDKEGEVAVPDDPVPANKKDYNKKRYIAWYGGSQIYQQNLATQIATGEVGPGGTTAPGTISSVAKYANFDMYNSFAIKSTVSEHAVTDENWLYEHSYVSGDYNSRLIKRRLSLYRVKDAYSGIYFYPVTTQPSSSLWFKVPKKRLNTNYLPHLNPNNWEGLNGDVKNSSDGLIYQSIMAGGTMERITGLKGVSASTFGDCVSVEVKQAILDQQELEKTAWPSKRSGVA